MRVLLGQACAIVSTLMSPWNKLLGANLYFVRSNVTSGLSLLGLILFVEKCKIIGVFLLFSGNFLDIHLKELVRRLLILIGGRLLMITDAVMAVVSDKSSVAANIIWILVTAVS
jgi:hypothetical protein